MGFECHAVLILKTACKALESALVGVDYHPHSVYYLRDFSTLRIYNNSFHLILPNSFFALALNFLDLNPAAYDFEYISQTEMPFFLFL